MEQVLPIIIAVILLLLPFFYLTKAIFFFRENRALKYRSINIRALIYALAAFIIIGVYISIPAMIVKMETAVKAAPVGAYAGINSKDTIVLNGYLMKHKYGEFPMNNYSSTYFISTAMNDKDIWGKVKNGFAHYFLGRKIDIDNEILSLNNPIRDSYYNIQPTKKTKKNQPNPNPQNAYIINRYTLSLKSDTLSLAPVNGPAGTLRFIRFANFY